MTDIIKPHVDVRDEEDPFLIPPGQRGSYVDALAAAQRTATAIRRDISSSIVVLVILEVSQWTLT